MLVDQRYLTQPSEMQKRSFQMIQPNVTTRVLITYVGEYVGGSRVTQLQSVFYKFHRKFKEENFLLKFLSSIVKFGETYQLPPP